MKKDIYKTKPQLAIAVSVFNRWRWVCSNCFSQDSLMVKSGDFIEVSTSQSTQFCCRHQETVAQSLMPSGARVRYTTWKKSLTEFSEWYRRPLHQRTVLANGATSDIGRFSRLLSNFQKHHYLVYIMNYNLLRWRPKKSVGITLWG